MFKLKSIKNNEARLYVLFLFMLFPLILFSYDNGSFRIQSILLFLTGMSWLLFNFLRIRKREWGIRQIEYLTDLPVLAAVIYAFTQILLKVIQSTGEESISFDIEITVIALAAIYWVATSRIILYKYYFDLMLFSALLFFGALLCLYLIDNDLGGLIALIAEDEYAIASYTLLACTIAVVMYCRCRDKMQSIFYFSIALTGFFVLFINHNLVSIYMMTAVFLAVPVLFRPVAELVKRDMQLFLVFLFLLSSMSLLTNYTSLIQKELPLNVENSIFLDIVIAIGAVVFFLYWNRIPDGSDMDKLVLRKMRKAYLFILKTMAIFLAAVLLAGDRWQELPDSALLRPLKRLAVSLCEEVGRGESAVYLSFEYAGMAGGLLLMLFASYMIARLRRNYHMDKPLTVMLILISDLFLLQLVFWKPNINSLPIYFLILIFAAFSKESRRKVTARKVKTLSHKL